jgi:flagellar assembly factor FliW
MKFETTRFGQIEVESEDIIIFPDGPLGFPDCTRFTLVDEERSYPFRMLQSLDNQTLAFVVVDPLVARADYHFNVTKEDLKFVKSETTEDLLVYVIVTMSSNIEEVTVNLQGPLVINPKQKLGHQYVLINEGYTTRERLLTNVDQSQMENNNESVEVVKTEQKKAI